MKALLLIILGLVYAASGQTVTCPGPYHAIGNGCYIFPDTEQFTWYDANIFCQFAGGHLVNIDSSAEQSALNTYYNTHFNTTGEYRWIGLTDSISEGIWRWVPSGVTLDYTNWYPGEPTTGDTWNCAAWITGIYNNWESHPCNDHGHYLICETLPL